MDHFKASFSIEEFCSLPSKEITKKLKGEFDKESKDLRKILRGFDGRIIFGYSIPGISKPIDVVLLIKGFIFVIEYRYGATEYEQHARRMAHGYAYWLKYYHSRSRDNYILPILVATDAPDDKSGLSKTYPDNVYGVVNSNSKNLQSIINSRIDYIQLFYSEECVTKWGKDWENEWAQAPFKNSPSLIDHQLVSQYVDELLSCNVSEEFRFNEEFCNNYLIWITRDIEKARKHVMLRKAILADEVYVADDENYETSIGMLTSSNGSHVQGQNFDSSIVMWNADIRYNKDKNDWDYYQTNGVKWMALDENKQDIMDTYRTMLKSARRCLIIYVPKGIEDDPMFSPEFFEDTYQYLKSIRICEL